VAHETGVANTVDPVAGSEAIERLTDEIEQGARALLTRIDAAGGTLKAIETGFIQREIQESAYRAQMAIDEGVSVVVGVNKYSSADKAGVPLFQIDPEIERRQIARVRTIRAKRDERSWRVALDGVRRAASGRINLVPPIIAAVEANATVGEISDAMRSVFGEFEGASTI
jgi:methylmalonyl-CoA mutase N-terminal domain/subunit